MIRVLLKIWPSFIPIALLLLWYVFKYQRVRKIEDVDNPKLRDEPWGIALAAAVVIAVVCLFASVLMQDGVKGEYVPASIQDGELTPGEIKQP